jgi:PAS domain S-box-containing protein
MSGERPSSSTYVRALEREDPAVTVLCVTPDEPTLGDLADGLEAADPSVEAIEARTPDEALHVLDAADVGCVVSTLALGDTGGLDFLAQVRSEYDTLPFVLLADGGSERVAAEAVNAGADGYVPYDGDPGASEFETLVDRIETVVRDYRSHQRFEDATELLFRLTEYTSDTLWMFTADWSETVVMNSAYENVWDRSQADVVADPSDFLEGIHPDDRPAVVEKMEVLSGGEPADLEYRVRTGDGIAWVSVHAEPVFVDGDVEYVAGFTRDITERRERERAVEESSERMETLVQNLPVVVFTLDTDGVFTTSAGAALETIGLEPGDLVGSSVYEAYAEYDELLSTVDRALDGEETAVTLEVAGSTFETLYRPIEDEMGAVTEVVGVSRDVTQLRRREQRLERVNEATRELQHARSGQEVGDVAVDIVDSVIDCPVTAYWEYDADRDVLEPTVATDRALSVADVDTPAELATIGPGHDEMAVFREGDPRWVEDYGDLSNPSSPGASLGRLLLVPFGDHGMLNIGHPDPGSFDDFDRYLVEILGQTAAAALDRVERESALRNRTEELETLLNNAPLMFYAFEPDGTIVESRGRGLRELGLEPGEAVGSDIFRMYADEPAITEAIETALSGVATSETVEFGGQWLDNTFVPVSEGGDVVRVIGVAFDVTAQKTAQHQFEALSESAIAISDSATEDDAVRQAVAVVETVMGDHTVVYWDCDEEREELVATAVSDPSGALDGPVEGELVHEAGDPFWRCFEAGETVVENDFSPGETVDGSPLESMILAPVGDHGLLTIGSTDAGAFEERHRHLTGTLGGLMRSTLDRLAYERELETSRTELERSNESLQQFAYVASHDLQEPLRMVSSYVSLLEAEYGDAFDEEGEEYMHYAVDGAQRMQEMIDALLQYSRVQTRGEEFADVDLEAVFEETVRSLEMLIEEEDATVTAADIPPAHADRSQVAQLLQNLVKNAVTYAGPGATVAVEGVREDGRVHLTVSDDGPGIEASQHDRIFEIFKSNEGGTGIGLAMCQRIAHRHDGDIWVESDPGEGATFHVTLPATDDGIDAETPATAVQARTETDGGRE